MAVVFVLGPSEWRGRRQGDPPLEIRRRLAQRLADIDLMRLSNRWLRRFVFRQDQFVGSACA